MDNLVDQFTQYADWMAVLSTADKILSALFFVVVCYLLFFAIASTRKKEKRYNPAIKNHRYAVLFFLEHDGVSVLETIHSFISQSYPREKFDLILIHNPNRAFEVEKISGLIDKTIETDSKDYNKAQSIRFAVSELPDDSYDGVVVMNDISIVQPDFLMEINNAYDHLRDAAIQTHRAANDIKTDIALFGAVSEEINNAIFRKGHVNVGLSSGLIGSGMVFSFPWLKANLKYATNSDLEKQLEKMLLEQFIYIEYLEYVVFYEKKATKFQEFYRQRNAWLFNQFDHIKMLFTELPSAITQGNYDYGNKIIQWMIPSRIILMGALILITFFFLFVSWGMAIKWFIILLMLITSFSIALPDRYIDARFIKALRSAPLLFLITIFNIIKRKIFPEKTSK